MRKKLIKQELIDKIKESGVPYIILFTHEGAVTDLYRGSTKEIIEILTTVMSHDDDFYSLLKFAIKLHEAFKTEK
jgi:2',3'-cyclic-nucleotide 2'-phosphodiesterase (5'-nucleotidase family)